MNDQCENPAPDSDRLARIIRKIKSCMALSKSSNEHEAALALRQAQSLMAKYRVSPEMMHFSTVGKAKSDHTHTRRSPSWALSLAAVVADAFNCMAITNVGYSKQRGKRVASVEFVGVDPSQSVALYAYDVLLPMLTSQRKLYVSEVRSGARYGRFSPETCGNHFALAWVVGVSSTLDELSAKTHDSVDNSSRSLVAVQQNDKQLIQEYLSNQGVGSKRRGRTPKLFDRNAVAAGHEAGSNAPLHQAVYRDDEVLAITATPPDEHQIQVKRHPDA